MARGRDYREALRKKLNDPRSPAKKKFDKDKYYGLVNEDVYAKITTANGFMYINYDYILKYAHKKDREKIIETASKNGGWKLVTSRSSM